MPGGRDVTTSKDKGNAAQAEESQVALEPTGPVAPVAKGDGVGEVDEKVNPAQDELQKRVDEAEAKGYYGVEADKTPDEHYTVAGVTAGKPTPETTKGGNL
jgi:hypothetical protein